MDFAKVLGRNKAAVLGFAVLMVVGRVAFAGPTSSVSISQENFNWDTDTDTFSPVGQVQASAATDSYLNLVDPSGNWVVQNLFIPGGASVEESFALPGASDGTQDTSATFTQSLSSTPLSAFAYNPSSTVTYTPTESYFDNEGAANDTSFDPLGDYDPAGGFKPGAPGNTINFSGGPTLTIVYRAGVPNVQAADNQCVPASLANGLAWLKTNQNLQVTQANNTGLKGDATLVGTLDTTTNRTVTSRTSGAGVTAANQIDGLLKYLDDNNLTTVTVKHEGFASAANRTVTSSGNTLTSTAVAQVVTFQFIQDELTKGAAVQAWESWANGAHAVEITGCGFVLGKPWISFTSDLLQTPVDNGTFFGLVPPDSFGTLGVNFSYLGSPDGFGRLRFLNEAGTPTLTFAVAEEVPEPASLGLLGAGAMMLISRRRSRA